MKKLKLFDFKNIVPQEESEQHKPVGGCDFMIDAVARKGVQIEVREDGAVLWVNIDGVCRLRCSQIEHLEITDGRKKLK